MTSKSEPSAQPAYPTPAVSLFPIFSAATILSAHGPLPACVLGAGWRLPVTTGRMGLSLALEHMGIRDGEEVLIPAYHCNSMVEPVVNASARPVFYRVRDDTSVDLDDVEARVNARTRVLMVTHYFGFPQNLTAIRAFCDARNLVLIEDCAHVFFGEHAGKPVGSYGDYAFASPMKFFPICDGGYLISRRHRVDRIPTKSSGLRFSLKAAQTILGRSVQYKRLGPLRHVLTLSMQVKNSLGASMPRSELAVETSQAPGQAQYNFDGYFSGLAGEFDPAWIHTGMSSTSRAIIALTAKSRIYHGRRANYSTLQNALAGLPGCKPLYPELPRSLAPYVFPLLVDDPQKVFPALKRHGVPIARFGEYLWDGFDRSICPIAVEFSRRVLQFPCHQELTAEELAWMIGTIRQVMLA
jgi:dTDP-4-amino-4,6-dideoxygalactose transaminase